MQETRVIQLDGESKVALVFGQMNEPPGARARVALTGLTVAEYFRDEEGQDGKESFFSPILMVLQLTSQCSSSLTIFSALPKPVLKCPLFSAVFLPPSATSPH